jgi:polyisoprenoid-binding protein YceI
MLSIENRFKPVLFVATMVMVLAPPVRAVPIDVAKSSVSAVGQQLGVPVTGKFNKINGEVVFNSAQLAQSKARIDIDVASYDMGLPEYNQNVIGPDWFNAAKFPKASFVSKSMKAVSANRFMVSGQFSLKGRAQNITFPVTLKRVGTDHIFDGVFMIKRTAFNVGSGEWLDTSVVADQVAINFHIVVPVHK